MYKQSTGKKTNYYLYATNKKRFSKVSDSVYFQNYMRINQ
jgi:uncharacterized protein YcgL (UPF0745 family)